jgi:hypothetical protein
MPYHNCSNAFLQERNRKQDIKHCEKTGQLLTVQQQRFLQMQQEFGEHQHKQNVDYQSTGGVIGSMWKQNLDEILKDF